MIWNIEKPKNEMDHIISYASGTPEREKLLKEIEAMKSRTEEIPLIINGKEVKTEAIIDVVAPHEKDIVLAKASLATEDELKEAIDAALEAHEKWADMNWYHRAAVFLRAADILAGPQRIKNIELKVLLNS